MLIVQNFTRRLVIASACVVFIFQSRTENHGSFERMFIPKANCGYMLKLSNRTSFSSFLDISSKVNFVLTPFQIQNDPSCSAAFAASHNVLFFPFRVCQYFVQHVSPLQSDSTCVRSTLPECACHRFRFHPGGVPREQPWTSATSRCARAPACMGG